MKGSAFNLIPKDTDDSFEDDVADEYQDNDERVQFKEKDIFELVDDVGEDDEEDDDDEIIIFY